MTDSVSTPPSDSPNTAVSKRRNWAMWLVLIGLLLLVGWLAYKGWRLYTLSNSLLAHRATAETLLEDGVTNIDPDTAVLLAQDIRGDVVALKSEVEPFLPLAPYLTWLPEVGPLMGNAEELLIMADTGTHTAVLLADSLAPTLTIVQDDTLGSERIPQLVQVLSNAQPAIAQAETSLAQFVTARNALEVTEAWPWTIRNLLRLGDEYLPLAQDGLKMAQVLPAMLGRDEPRTYLLLAQNEEEIRATGGFISGAGLLTVDNGRIQEINFSDAYAVDDYLNKPYEFPPEPFYDFMGLELFVFRDSNYWPDFPTSAEQAMTLYTYGQGTELDGMVAFDQRFMQLLIGAFGEVEVAELDITLTSNNIRQQLREAWAAGDGEGQWRLTRKSFMGPMAGALRQKVESDLGSVDPVGLVTMLDEAISQKHLQIYMRDPAVALALAEAGWDGRITVSPAADVLMVVDQNMGFNKVNALVEQTIDYNVVLGTAATPTTAVLNVTYTHTGSNTAACDPSPPHYKEGLQYDQLVDRCYWNYQRVYVPTGSTLQSASQHPVPAEMLLTARPWMGQAQVSTGENGLTTFANLFLLERTSSITTSYMYDLPASVGESLPNGNTRYTLSIPKQAGAKPHQLRLAITLPDGAILAGANPTPTAVNGRTLEFETHLEENYAIVLEYAD